MAEAGGGTGSITRWGEAEVVAWLRGVAARMRWDEVTLAPYINGLRAGKVTGRSLLTAKDPETMLRRIGVLNTVHCQMLCGEIGVLKLEDQSSQPDSPEGAPAGKPARGSAIVSPPKRGPDWKVLKEGFLWKTKRKVGGGYVSRKRRFFELKQHISGRHVLEYFEGKTLKGSADLHRCQAVPLPGSSKFEVTVSGRVFFLEAENNDVAQAHDWVLQLQSIDRQPHPAARRPTRHSGTIIFQIGDELLPLAIKQMRTGRAPAGNASGGAAGSNGRKASGLGVRMRPKKTTAGRSPLGTVAEGSPSPGQSPSPSSGPLDAGSAGAGPVAPGDGSQASTLDSIGLEQGAVGTLTPPGPPHQTATLRHSWPLQGARLCSDGTGSSAASFQSSSRLFRITELEFGELLGEGFFGRVFKASHRHTGEVLVVKELKESDPAARADFVDEMALLKSLAHPNVLRFVGIFSRDGKLNLVTEYIAGGTLQTLIMDKERVLPWDLRMQFARDISAGMSYLHYKRVIHRDLKSENCLIRSNLSVVVCDFGLARVMEGEVMPAAQFKDDAVDRRASTFLPRPFDDATACRPRMMSVVGTPYWMAPELLAGREYNQAADVFSFGIVVCEIIGRVEADPDIMPRTNKFTVNEELFTQQFAGDCPPSFLQLAFDCCALSPMARPTFPIIQSKVSLMRLKTSSCIVREALGLVRGKSHYQRR